MRQRISDLDQLGFSGLLMQADADNQARRFERETAHLPSTYDEAIPFYARLIDKHHFAMVMARADEVMHLREEAHRLACRLNGGNGGILAHADAPGYVLARETAAAADAVPLWGQTGSFILYTNDIRVRVAMDGLFGLGSSSCYWPGFTTHAVDFDRPFLSETGYRWFYAIHADPVFALPPDDYVKQVLEWYVKKQLKGRLLSIDPRYRRDQ